MIATRSPGLPLPVALDRRLHRQVRHAAAQLRTMLWQQNCNAIYVSNVDRQ